MENVDFGFVTLSDHNVYVVVDFHVPFKVIS